MKPWLAVSVLVAWALCCVVAWIAVKERPLLAARKPAPAVTAASCVYLDRDYRLEAVPPELAGAVLVPVFRHGTDPVHLLLDAPGTLVLLAPEGDVPGTWGVVEAAPFDVRCRGAQSDLTRAYLKELAAGEHVIRPLGPRKVASPLLILSPGEVRRVETPGGLWRRAEMATRGFPRRALFVAAAGIPLVGALLAILLAARRPRKSAPAP